MERDTQVYFKLRWWKKKEEKKRGNVSFFFFSNNAFHTKQRQHSLCPASYTWRRGENENEKEGEKKTLKSRREREKTGNLNTTSPVHWFTSRLPSYTWKLRKKKHTHWYLIYLEKKRSWKQGYTEKKRYSNSAYRSRLTCIHYLSVAILFIGTFSFKPFGKVVWNEPLAKATGMSY